MSHIFNHLNISCSLFSQMPIIFDVKCRVFEGSKFTSVWLSPHSSSEKFRKWFASFLLSGLLRKTPPILPGFDAAKIVIFRKCHKKFLVFLHFRKTFGITFWPDFTKSFKMKLLQKTHFSQMFLKICLFQYVKEREGKLLNFWPPYYFRGSNILFLIASQCVQCLRQKILKWYLCLVHNLQTLVIWQTIILAVIVERTISINGDKRHERPHNPCTWC